MTAPAGASRATILDDAIAQLVVVANGVADGVFDCDGPTTLLEQAASLERTRQRVAAMDEVAPLSLDETRLVRRLLADAINCCDLAGHDALHADGETPIDAALCVALRRRLSGSVARRFANGGTA